LRIEHCAHALLVELNAIPDAASQRNKTQLERIDAGLSLWSGAGVHTQALSDAVRAHLASAAAAASPHAQRD
jgi:hypothetical protein